MSTIEPSKASSITPITGGGEAKLKESGISPAHPKGVNVVSPSEAQAEKLENQKHPSGGVLLVGKVSSLANLWETRAKSRELSQSPESSIHSEEGGKSELQSGKMENLKESVPANEKAEKNARICQHVHKEIGTTETSYNEQLTLLCKFLNECLSKLPKDSQEAKKIKSMLGKYEVAKQVSTQFLGELSLVIKDTNGIAKCFSKYTPYLQGALVGVVIGYDTMAKEATDAKQGDPKLVSFLSKQFMLLPEEEKKGLTLTQLMVTPVQRGPRYKLLLEQLEKYAPEEDKVEVKKALDGIIGAAQNINAKKREQENSDTRLKFDTFYAGFSMRSSQKIKEELAANYTGFTFPSDKKNKAFFDTLIAAAKNWGENKASTVSLVKIDAFSQLGNLMANLPDDENIKKYSTGFALSFTHDEAKFLGEEISSLQKITPRTEFENKLLANLTALAIAIVEVRGPTSSTASFLRSAYF